MPTKFNETLQILSRSVFKYPVTIIPYRSLIDAYRKHLVQVQLAEGLYIFADRIIGIYFFTLC